jgi:large subunit ribosomal protein L6
MTKKKVKKEKIREDIEIPEGVDVEIDGRVVKIKKGGEEIEREVEYPVKKEDNKIIIESKEGKKRDKKLVNTVRAHIVNMISGLEKKYEYELKICSVHFPMTVEVKNQVFQINNFLGENIPRKAKILPNVEVEVNKENVIVRSSSKENAGQTAANIENATIVRNRDRRIFQDGIFITKKEKGRRR